MWHGIRFLPTSGYDREMSTTTQWRVITPTLLDELPDAPGIFEIGNLVRNVLFIGAAPTGLAAAVRSALGSSRLVPRAHCIRFEVGENAEERARTRLAEYRHEHAGALPYAHRDDPLTRMLEARRPPSRALPLSRAGRRAGPDSLARSNPSA